jgi:hypothetical protein
MVYFCGSEEELKMSSHELHEAVHMKTLVTRELGGGGRRLSCEELRQVNALPTKLRRPYQLISNNYQYLPFG